VKISEKPNDRLEKLVKTITVKRYAKESFKKLLEEIS
jgi:hypothetical protein